MGPVVGKFGEILSIYHVVDEYAGYTGQDQGRRREIQQAEQSLLDMVDLSIVVSRELFEAKHGECRNMFVVPNAVDFAAFAAASARAETPADLAAIPRPRIGYSGLVGVRLDLDLVDAVASACPDFHYVFIGSVDGRECSQELRRLESRPNIHFLGEKPAARVPDYVAGFDVGMLPYHMNLETRHISPLKLYEYLAAGVPVVSTPIPATRPFTDLIRVAGSSEEYARELSLALDQDSEDCRQKRRSVAGENTWDHRVRQIEKIIAEALGSKDFGPGKQVTEPAS
jgi:glycosyltransferase involved in cell wall biosynthesis